MSEVKVLLQEDSSWYHIYRFLWNSTYSGVLLQESSETARRVGDILLLELLKLKRMEVNHDLPNSFIDFRSPHTDISVSYEGQ